MAGDPSEPGLLSPRGLPEGQRWSLSLCEERNLTWLHLCIFNLEGGLMSQGMPVWAKEQLTLGGLELPNLPGGGEGEGDTRWAAAWTPSKGESPLKAQTQERVCCGPPGGQCRSAAVWAAAEDRAVVGGCPWPLCSVGRHITVGSPGVLRGSAGSPGRGKPHTWAHHMLSAPRASSQCEQAPVARVTGTF